MIPSRLLQVLEQQVRLSDESNADRTMNQSSDACHSFTSEALGSHKMWVFTSTFAKKHLPKLFRRLNLAANASQPLGSEQRPGCDRRSARPLLRISNALIGQEKRQAWPLAGSAFMCWSSSNSARAMFPAQAGINCIFFTCQGCNRRAFGQPLHVGSIFSAEMPRQFLLGHAIVVNHLAAFFHLKVAAN